METINIAILFALLFLLYTMYKAYNVYLAKNMKKSKKVRKHKSRSVIIPSEPIVPMADTIALDEPIVMSDDEMQDVDGIYDAPMYMPADADGGNIFLLSQINQVFNDTVAYVDPDFSEIENVDA